MNSIFMFFDSWKTEFWANFLILFLIIIPSSLNIDLRTAIVNGVPRIGAS